MRFSAACLVACYLVLPVWASEPGPAHGSELKPITSLPIGGGSSVFNPASNILYTATSSHFIYAYDVVNHVLLPHINPGDEGIGRLSVNPISNTIFFSGDVGRTSWELETKWPEFLSLEIVDEEF